MDTNKMRDLRAVAESAPSGPWLVENDSMYFKEDGYTRHLIDADCGQDVEEDRYYAALAFMAAANPSVVLGLLAEIEQLAFEPAKHSRRLIDQLKAENEDYKSGQERYEQIIEDLKAENEALRKALSEISEQVDGNIRCTVRDVVNGLPDVQDIYGYCDTIDEIIDAAMAKEKSHG